MIDKPPVFSFYWPRVEKGVLWLRADPGRIALLSFFAIVFVAMTAYTWIQTYPESANITGSLLGDRILTSGVLLGSVGVVGLPILIEWRRQNRETALKAKAAKEYAKGAMGREIRAEQEEKASFQAFQSFLEAQQTQILEQHQYLFSQLNLSEVPEVNPKAFQYDSKLFTPFYPEMMPTPIMKTTLDNRSLNCEALIIKYRLRQPTQDTTVHVLIIMPALAKDELNVRWIHQSLLTPENKAKTPALFDKKYDGRFMCLNKEARHYITPENTSVEEEMPLTLIALQELVLGIHNRFELVQEQLTTERQQLFLQD